jgi:hypothetical protein
MIDRLELRIPLDVPKREKNWAKYPRHPAKLNSPYATTVDADTALALRVHFNHRVPIAKDKMHLKVDFTDTRLLSAEDLVWRLMSLFRIQRDEALSFRIARIDFAADIYGVPVEWFKRNCRVKCKRSPRSYEDCKTDSGKGSVTSVEFGKRPELYRIYNKVAERRAHGVEVLYDGMFSGAPAPTVTRVERQCSGSAIPREVGTLGALFEHGADVSPFPKLVCRRTGAEFVSTEDWKPQKWLMSLGLESAVQDLGEAVVRARLNRTGNANRMFEKYSDLLRFKSPGVTEERLRDIYRRSTIKQLNIPRTGSDGKIHYPAGGVVLTL